ncbi:MAG: hypothetical protein SH817_16320 [Leptospira sp.]|nr:hypothetical protein [Leptospira sp.]
MIRYNSLILLLLIFIFPIAFPILSQAMTPDSDLPKGWEFQFNAPFGQDDDITPIPGPFKPYQMDAYYLILQTQSFARLVGASGKNMKSRACLALDTKKGKAVIKFLFDRTFYLLDVKKISTAVYELIIDRDSRKIKLSKENPTRKNESDYKLRFTDGIDGGDDLYADGNYAAVSNTYLMPTMSACINQAIKISMR